jgi:acetyl-CoA carboxylase biotin carboxyl carrier protein
MSTINQEDVFLILKLLEESPFDELQLETGDLRLHVKRKGSLRGLKNLEENDNQSAPGSGLETKRAESSLGTPPDIPAPGRGPSPPAGLPSPTSEKAMEGLVAVKAPMLGTFYRTPKPGAPPFVEVGAMVGKDDPLCIIEVMKLFNTVKAGVQGRVAQICAEQGQLVEYQQVLFLIENKSV